MHNTCITRAITPVQSRLVARTEPGAVVAVELIVERDVIAPGRVFLKYLLASVDWPAAIFTFEGDARREISSAGLIEIHR